MSARGDRRTFRTTLAAALAAPWLLVICGITAGCAVETASGPETRRTPPSGTQTPSARRADPQTAQRLSRIMVRLLQAVDHKRPLDQVSVGILDEPGINAASGGSGKFYVTRGLLERANDEQLQAILAHEVAHDDLGHVGKQQTLGTGLNIGAAILDQIFPGTGRIAPLAGTLILRAYSRNEELQADKHGVELLKRVGSSKDAMERALMWIRETSGGGGGGGFLATHPALDERIDVLRRLPS